MEGKLLLKGALVVKRMSFNDGLLRRRQWVGCLIKGILRLREGDVILVVLVAWLKAD